MDELIELVLDILLESSIGISSNKKVSKWIRYPIIVFLLIFFTVITFGIMILGIMLIEESILASLIFICCGIVMLIGSIIKFKKIYLHHKSSKGEEK